MQALSAKRRRVLEAVERHERAGSFPLVRELASELGLKGHTSLTGMLDSLALEGLLQKLGGGQERHRRIYRLTPEGHRVLAQVVAEADGDVEALCLPPLLHLPILGAIPAGPLQEVAQSAGEFFDACETLCAKPGDFFLTVKGDSMNGDGILSGDLALIRPGIQVASGQIAAVQIEGRDEFWKSTLKRIHISQDLRMVRLEASNPRYPPIDLPSDEVSVVGLYKGLVRAQK